MSKIQKILDFKTGNELVDKVDVPQPQTPETPETQDTLSALNLLIDAISKGQGVLSSIQVTLFEDGQIGLSNTKSSLVEMLGMLEYAKLQVSK